MGSGDDIYAVKTIVHHNSETSESVRGYEAPGSYIRNITYGRESRIDEKQIEKLIDISYSCQQYIRWDCKGAMFGFWYSRDIDNWWIGRGWKNQFYWGGAEVDSKSCGCFPYCYPTVRNSTCNCDANLKLNWLEDSGLLLDKTRLPVLQLRFGDTGESYEAGQYILGPLVCRARAHKVIDKGIFIAPVTIESPGYPLNYPPPFYRYKWRVIIGEQQIIELVFPYYDVIHYGAYNSVPNCRFTFEIDIKNSTGFTLQSIYREKASPPYFISDGNQTIVDMTFTTCNQLKDIEKKGFMAKFRKAECVGCNVGFGQNVTNCHIKLNQCATISSHGYPFPHYVYGNFGEHYMHLWNISTIEGHVIQIEFNDFDIIFTPGVHYCDSDLLTVYDISLNETIKTGTYCNINRYNIGKLLSDTSYMLLQLKTTLKKVGNSRGFHATIRSVPKTNTAKKWINNIAEGKPTDQSSTRAGLEASLAVDGNMDRKQLSKCTATNYEHEPWWRVNLQKRHRIYGVQISSADIILQQEDLYWPYGQYGLPMPVSGCPSYFENKWQTGTRFHDVRHEPVQDDRLRYWSQGIMLKGGATDNGIEQHFCIRDYKPINDTPVPNANNFGWMPGKYCIFQVGDTCPEGFTSGSIVWFDKSNTTSLSESRNQVKGVLPKGFYTKYNTTIYFCCREDGNPDVSIKLPKDRPFYLLQYGDECQKVEGMSEIEHFFHYEEEVQLSGISLELIFIPGTTQLKFQDPHPRVDIALFEKGLTLHYCYYDVSDQLKGFQVLVDTTPDTYGFTRHYDDITGISRAVGKPFLSAVECASFDVTSSDTDVITLNCQQPIEGQYVVIFMKDRFDSLRLCEVKVFGEESCGRPLGMATEEILDMAISASSVDNHGFIHHQINARLNSPNAWCATINDPQKYIQIDLLYGNDKILSEETDEKILFPIQEYVTVVGIAMQGMVNAFKSSFVTQFQLFFSNDTKNWTFEEEPIGRQKVYKCVQCDSQSVSVDGNDIVMHHLLKPIFARYVRVKILSFKLAPCLRLEVIGCRDSSKSCVMTLTEPMGVIYSPNYPFYYAQSKSCWWHINPGPNKHVELDFVIIDLATKDKNMGKCYDSLSIYHPNETVIESHTRPNSALSIKTRLYPKKIISNGAISLHLKTCFRFSISRFQGFYAKYKTSLCPGCGIGDSVCNKIYNCSENCGRILSINYPMNYTNNHRCQWLITAPQESYINVTIDDFDVPNTSIGTSTRDCIFDYISFTDVSTGQLIGKFCNIKKPPKHILSNWNKLLIEFNTDSTISGRGFSITYSAQKFELSDKLAQQMIGPLGACPTNWIYFRGYCYNAFFEKESLQWYQSEEKCAQFEKGRDGHLVSITDQHEMQVVHYLLINKWKVSPHQSIYIGLIDTNREGFYNWSDGNPMSYTDWSYGAENEEDSQPDGGAFEDCTVIKIDSSHSTANWHDIPCSLGKRTNVSQKANINNTINTTKIMSDVISSYICKMDSSYSSQQFRLRKPLFTNIINKNEKEIYKRVDDNRYFVCENLEVISNLFKCDGTPNCRDGSDEAFGCDITGNSCLESQFQCANGRCIAIGMYCDFVDDCGDGSDELFCERRQCKKTTEFRCNNHQCIPLSKRCDLLTDCKDLSDEGFACTLIATPCNLNTTFQCYYGNCIPIYTLCDRHRDCPGKFHEDEQSSKCQRNSTAKVVEKRGIHQISTIWHTKQIHDQMERVWSRQERSVCLSIKRKTCRDLQIYDNIQTNGTYFIEPEDSTTIGMSVQCYFTPNTAKTVIHHDSEVRIYVRSDIDGPASYWRVITYQYNMDSIAALIANSDTCRQYISWQCSGTGFRFNSTKPVSYWISRQGGSQYSWGGALSGRCSCYPNCVQKNLSCNCDSEIKFEWQEDSGYITDKNKLPVSRLVFGETYKLGQSGYFYLGPLECDGNARNRHHLESCGVNSKLDFKCQSGQIIDDKFRCIYEFDQLGYQIGCRDVSHLRDCETYECPPDYVKCTDSYCIPPRYICNGKWDCVGGSDEVGCARYICPGQYKCANESSCVLLHQLCDGIRHCPLGDDEWFCDLTCPDNCTCIGLYVDCRNANLSRLPIEFIPKDTRKLELTNNYLGPNLSNSDFSSYGELGELILQRNGIEVIKSRKFLQLTNLYKLDLRYNNIQVLESAAFAGLKRVTTLLLEENYNLAVIEPRAFVGLTSLRQMNISNTNIKVLYENVFLQMSSLQTLILMQNGLQVIEKGAFNELSSLISLDIRDNDFQTFPKDMFSALKSLRFLSTDSFKFCCLAANIVPFERCLPPQDEISDCEDLMSNIVQRIILWFLGVVALLANASVIIWRFQTRLYSNPVSSTLILSLGCADFLMGIYLMIIASVDEFYRGRYIENSDIWKNSILCNICGFLSTVSSEVSVATLVFITVDRLICISFPFSLKKYTMSLTYRLITLSWIIVLFIAGLPLLPIPYFNGKFYARSGTCLALHITPHKPDGWEYSVAIFLCVNLVAFLVIVGCYCYMYKTIRLSRKKMNRLKARQVRETQVGRQMALIVITNFLCWFPVIVMGMMSLTGFTIPGTAYSWTAVFVFPLNSATNPIIYSLAQSPISLFTFKSKRDSLTSRSLLMSLKHKGKTVNRSTSNSNNKLIRGPPGYLPLIDFLAETEDLKPRHLLEISYSISQLIKEVHGRGHTLGGIDFQSIYVSNKLSGGRLEAYIPDLNIYPVVDTEVNDEYAFDMEELGNTVKRMLRIYHNKINCGPNDDNKYTTHDSQHLPSIESNDCNH
ncbi:uncharacterized protein LOC128963584 [Oppia nitens]|uniref:uncharacterized protein LOC128963584 n=1 Tax=Oppia nitens TaxID=1686743 RepID=UPI0023DC049E|nr:uncharacterized protein LOC128963584 [Oppia nitens]